jgi:hypothetical protein
MECQSCGAQISNAAGQCPYCQAEVAPRVPPAMRAAPAPAPGPGPVPVSLPPMGPVSYQRVKPKGKIWVLVVLIVVFWPVGIWYAVTHDLSR